MLTPDGARYVAMTKQRVARPFHLRWLAPFICRDQLRRWVWLSHLSIVAIGVLTALYCHSAWMAAVAFLPGITLSWRHPVLVDAFGMALALGAALLLPICWPAAVLVTCLAGMTRETAPVWAALYAWNPLLLLGLVPVGVRALIRQGDDVLDEQNAWILAHPFRAAQMFHQGRWTDASLMVAPWGGLLAGLAFLDLRLGAALVAGYAQLLVATDSVRLYQWAAPALALACAQGLAPWALPLVAVSIVFNPWKGNGL